MPTKKPPKFRRPPVTEVVCGVYFSDLTKLQAAHLGALWKGLGKRYSRTETVASLPPINLLMGVQPHYGLFISDQQGVLPRTWFIESDGQTLVQVQRDRLILNWRQITPDHEYPSYKTVIQEFRRIFRVFTNFVQKQSIGNLQMNGVELFYINHIVVGRELQSPNALPDVLRIFSWRSVDTLADTMLRTANCTLEFERPNLDGQLNMSVQTAQRLSDGQELVRFDLLARRLAPQITEDEVWSWFDRAHECIITTFVSSTDPDIQEKYWERYQ
jgi:uncharacterized protein (TIGR04255 family)